MENFKTITVFNPKGGVGKSSIISSLSYELTKYGKTLLIDCDPQGSSTYIYLDEELNKPENQNKNLLENFKDTITLEESVFCIRNESEENSGLYLLPAGNKANLRAFIDGPYRDCPDKGIKQIVEEAQKLGFKYVLFDLPGHIGFYEKTILNITTEIIPITEAEDLAIEELNTLLKEVKKVTNQLGGNGKLSTYLIINKIDTKNLVHNHWCNVIQKAMPFFTQFKFKQSKIFSSAISQHMSIQEWAKNNVNSLTISELGEKIK